MFLARFVLLFFIALALAACNPEDILQDDLAMAKQALLERDWPRAERVLERCLREERDSEKRWEAWQLLLGAINAVNQEPRASLECLEAMLVEYEDDDQKLAVILPQIGNYNQVLRHYDRAANAWSAYTELSGLTAPQLVNGYRQLAAAKYSQRHFEAAQEALQQCMALPIADHDKIWCMLDLADAGMGRQQWQDVADICQQILDSDPDQEVMGLAGYYRGDALEQMGKQEQALKQFEAARDSYPNTAVMDNRIEYLKKQIRAKHK